jgi:hypothetical protein
MVTICPQEIEWICFDYVMACTPRRVDQWGPDLPILYVRIRAGAVYLFGAILVRTLTP